MNWKNRLKLFVGLIGVGVLLFALTLLLNYSMTYIESRSAQLMTDTYTVGSEYSGIITKQYVTSGQHVKAGQSLFLLKSNLLNSDLSNAPINKNDGASNLDDQNQIVLKATNDGTVSDIAYLEGAFVPANKEVATIARDNSMYVTAKYYLSPPDYARLKNGDYTTVTLPNNQKILATIFDISVQNNDNSVETTVKARLSNSSQITFTSGTPVSVELTLGGKTLYGSVREGFIRMFKPKG